VATEVSMSRLQTQGAWEGSGCETPKIQLFLMKGEKVENSSLIMDCEDTGAGVVIKEVQGPTSRSNITPAI
jgi:hypothetical protein